MQSSLGVPSLEPAIDLVFTGVRRGSGDGASIPESTHSSNSSGNRSWADDAQNVPWGAASSPRRPSGDSSKSRTSAPTTRAAVMPTIESPLLPSSSKVISAAPVPVEAGDATALAESDTAPTVLQPIESPVQQSSPAERSTPESLAAPIVLKTTAEILDSRNRMAVPTTSPLASHDSRLPDASDEALRATPGVVGLGEGWASAKQPSRRLISLFNKSKPVEHDPLQLWETTAQISGPSKPSPLSGMKETFNRSRQAFFKPNVPGQRPSSALSQAKGLFTGSRLNVSVGGNDSASIPRVQSPAPSSITRKTSIRTIDTTTTSPTSIRSRMMSSRKSSIRSARSSQPPSPVPKRSASITPQSSLPPPWRPGPGGYKMKAQQMAPLISKVDDPSATSLDGLYQIYSSSRPVKMERGSTFGQESSPGSIQRSSSRASSQARSIIAPNVMSRSTSLASTAVTASTSASTGLIGMLPLNDVDPFNKPTYGMHSRSPSAMSSHVEITDSSYRVSELVAGELIKMSPSAQRTAPASKRKSWLPQTFSTDNLSRFFERDETEKDKKPSFIKRWVSRKSGGIKKSATEPDLKAAPSRDLTGASSMPYMSNFNDSTMTLSLEFEDDGDLGLDDILDSRRRARIVRSIKVDKAATQTPWSAAHRHGFSMDQGIAEEEDEDEDDEDDFTPSPSRYHSTDSLGNALRSITQFPLPPSSKSDSSPESDFADRLATPKLSQLDPYTTAPAPLFESKRNQSVESPTLTSSTLVSQQVTPKASWESYMPTPLGPVAEIQIPATATLSVGPQTGHRMSLVSENGESVSSDSFGDESVVHGHAVHVKSLNILGSRASYIAV